MDDKERQLGEVWKDRTFKAKRPWFVKTATGTPRFLRKRDAVAVGELYIRERDRLVEVDRTVS